jgi:PAS domain S-box-containing protein
VKSNLQEQTEIILDSIADGVFTVDSDWKITSFNRAAELITGVKREEALGRQCWEVFRAGICEGRCSLKHTMETGHAVVNHSIFIINSGGERVPVSISTALLRDREGCVIGGVETFRDLTVVEELRKELSGRHSFLDIISKNSGMHRLFGILEQVAKSNASVLLEGESGTGKELLAKAIHSLSQRSEKPMITINCGSLPDTLLESELFGYKKGAHSTAFKDKPGLIALADGGTLFLDEIGDISPALQIRLLRVLQDGIYEPLGSTAAEEADVRIVSATNKDLESLVEQGGFRKDLYYRIKVFRLVIPPLRERKEDIPLLAEHFIRKFNRLNDKEIEGVSPEVLPLLMSHDFPGNVRELENIIEYATVVCKNHLIGVEQLPDYLQHCPGSKGIHKADSDGEQGFSWEDMQRTLIYEALKRNDWNRSSTAAQLGIHPSTLWRRIKKLRMEVPKKDGRSRRS